MRKFNRLIYISLVTAMLMLQGCGKENSDSAVNESSYVSSSSAVESAAESSSKTGEIHAGKYLTELANRIKQGEYTIKCTVTSSAYDDVIKLTRVVNGQNVYQLQEESIGSYGVISVDGKTYDFDNLSGMYQLAKSAPPLSIVEEVINRNLPMSEERDDDSTDGMAVEQYTFTGDTYITNISFFFDKETGNLKKYELKYTIEGQDDVTESRVIDSMEYKADKTVFSTDFLGGMQDFGEMTEDERLSFCRNICSKRGITSDKLSQFDISEDDFKTIDFNSFLDLIYSA